MRAYPTAPVTTFGTSACGNLKLSFPFTSPSLPPSCRPARLPVSRSVKVPFSSSVVMVISRGNDGSAIAASPETGGIRVVE